MALRAKSRKRLILLAIVVGGLTLLGGGAYLGRMIYLENRAQTARAEGVQLYKQGEYEPALHRLGAYLGRHQDDVEALYMYATARRHVEMAGSKHLIQSAQLLQRLLALEPGHSEASRQLLELYDEIGYATEALELADRLLDENPQDPELIRLKVRALTRLQRAEKALPLSKTYNELEPEDLSGQILTLSLMHHLQVPPSAIQDRARDLESRYSDDPRFDLLLGIACRLSGQMRRSAELFDKAADQRAPDAQYVRLLFHELARLGLFGRATEVLEASKESDDPLLISLQLRRDFELGRFDAVLARTEDLSWAPDSAVRARMLVLRAMVYIQRDDREALDRTTTQLEAQENLLSEAWVPVLRMRAEGKKGQASSAGVLRGAVTRLPNSPLLRYLLAEELVALGESDLALAELTEAMRFAAGWPRPFIQASRLQMRQGRTDQAAALARQALRRNSGSMPAAMAFAQAQARRIDALEREELQSLQSLVAALAEALPEEPMPQLLQVDLAARLAGPAAAAAKAKRLLARDELPIAILGGLRRLDQTHDLGLGDSIPAAPDDNETPLRPSQALAKVIRTTDAGERAAAMRALEAYQAASDDPDDMGWRIARIRLIERSAPGEAPGAWRRFLSDHPGSIPARKAALDSGHVRRDQALAQEIIDQLKGLSGDQGLAWRVAQARLNLQKGRPADLQRAAQLLEQVVLAAPRRLEAQMMLVECLRRQGNYAKALNRIGQVVQISENSASLRLLQAELMFRYGDKGQAQQVLDSLLASPDLPSSVVRGASDLLARQGRYASAIRTLMRLHPPQETPADLQLARYQLQAGNTDRAEAIARKSVAEEPGAPAIAFLAELLARTGRADEGKAILGRLSRLEIDQSRRLMIQGRFAESYGDPQEAVSFYRRAVAAAPEDLATHVQLIRYLMTTGHADELAQAVTDAGDLPDETGMVAFLSDNIQLLRETADLAPARDFWLGAMTNAEHREAALAGIGLIRTVDARQEVAAEDLAELRRIADSEPDFLPVQLLAARLSMAAGRSQDAIAWANRAVQAFPDAIEPAWILSEALAAEGRWAEALSAAQQWRSRSRGQALGADMLIAEGQIQLGRADRAVAQLETHVQQAMENPHQAQPVINRYARALILAGKADQAAKALRPLLTTDARYRRAWITLAVLVIAEPDRSRAWLGEVTPLIPAGAHGEHITLADAWYQLSRRDERPEDIDRAEAILSPLIQVSPDAAITLGVMHDMQGQVAEAETLYRQGLEGDASESLSAIAANNLAMILVQRGEGLAEAQRLARVAVEARPRSANFHDTLAQAHLARRQFDRAVGTLEKAVRLEPVNPKWMLQLAEAQLRAGRSGEARKSLLKLQRIYPERNMLPPELRAQLADLDRRLRS